MGKPDFTDYDRRFEDWLKEARDLVPLQLRWSDFADAPYVRRSDPYGCFDSSLTPLRFALRVTQLAVLLGYVAAVAPASFVLPVGDFLLTELAGRQLSVEFLPDDSIRFHGPLGELLVFAETRNLL